MEQINSTLFNSVKDIIIQARQRVYRMVNSNLLETYWQIGKQIVEDEQQGKSRADYGKNVLKNLAKQLNVEFGKGFDESNLRNMRQFYKAFPICDALRHELSWSHYRKIYQSLTDEFGCLQKKCVTARPYLKTQKIIFI